MRAATILIVLATLATLRGAARADDPSPAEILYEEGQSAYKRADYAAAVAKWQASYDLSGESGLLFNLAQAYRLSGDCGRGLATYKRFIAADPTADQRPLAEDFTRELERTCTKQTAVVPPAPKPAPSYSVDRDTRPGRTLRIAGLATGGTGVAVLATGLLFGHHAQAIGGEVTDACVTSCDWTVQKSKDAAGRRDATIGYALDVVGVAAIAGGAVMYYLGSKSTVTVTPTPRESGAVVSWRGSW
jgi:tetratricopeptide (TPR) repeat protein